MKTLKPFRKLLMVAAIALASAMATGCHNGPPGLPPPPPLPPAPPVPPPPPPPP